MPLTTPEIISGAALLLAILSALWQRFGVILDIKKDQASMALNFQKDLSECRVLCVGNLSTTKDNVLTRISNEVNNLYEQLGKTSVQLVLADTRITKQEMKMDLFWGAVQETVKDMIKQPIHFRKDDLLDKFPNLKYEEMFELKTTLQIEKTEMLLNVKSLSSAKKTYLLALALMLAGIDSRLIDMEDKC